MRPQDDRSQQSILGLCDQDSGIVAEYVQIVSCQKHWRSPTTLERCTEDVPRWLLLPLHEARIRVDRGFVGCGEHTEISCMIKGLRRYVQQGLRSSLSTTPRTFMVLI